MAQKKKAQKKAKPNGSVKPKRSKGPRQEPLPGMEDRAIQELQDAALSYAEARDERMELSKQEADCKSRVLAIMKKHGKTVYRHDNIYVELIPEDVKVKVRVLEEGEEMPKPKQTDFDPEKLQSGEETTGAVAEG